MLRRDHAERLLVDVQAEFQEMLLRQTKAPRGDPQLLVVIAVRSTSGEGVS